MWAFCRNLLSRCFSCHRQEKYPCNVIFWVWARVKGRVFPGGQWDHFLAIIRKNILRAVFPGRGLMARWHNGGGGVLSSSRSGGRGARGRRQPTIMDSPSFHSLSFLVDVFVFVFVFPINFKVCSRITRLFVSIPFQNCPIHKKIVVDCVLVNNAF